MLKIRNFLLTALSGYAVCIILGLLVFGTSIFAFHYILFIITAFGFYGAVFYSVLKYFKIKNQILTAVALFILQMVLRGKLLHMTSLTVDFIYMLSLFISVLSYKIFIDKYPYTPILLRSFILPVILGLGNIFAVFATFLIFIHSITGIIWAIFRISQYSAIIGFGLGIGFDLFEIINDRVLINGNNTVI